jgi:hypothetical protein
MTVQSRHLGPIDLVGGVGGGAMDAVVTLVGQEVPLRLEIDFPQRFDERVVSKIDLALDSLRQLDGVARDTVASGLARESNAAAQLFAAWRSTTGADDDADPALFLRSLRATQITLLPDGGPNSRERLRIAYELAESPRSGQLTVRFREPTGPELDPTLRGAAA